MHLSKRGLVLRVEKMYRLCATANCVLGAVTFLSDVEPKGSPGLAGPLSIRIIFSVFLFSSRGYNYVSGIFLAFDLSLLRHKK